MERLTEYTRFHGSMLPVMNNSNRYSAIERLAAIEDILGDEYDLDELREMVQAKREGRLEIIEHDVAECIKTVKKAQAALRGE